MDCIWEENVYIVKIARPIVCIEPKKGKINKNKFFESVIFSTNPIFSY